MKQTVINFLNKFYYGSFIILAHLRSEHDMLQYLISQFPVIGIRGRVHDREVSWDHSWTTIGTGTNITEREWLVMWLLNSFLMSSPAVGMLSLSFGLDLKDIHFHSVSNVAIKSLISDIFLSTNQRIHHLKDKGHDRPLHNNILSSFILSDVSHVFPNKTLSSIPHKIFQDYWNIPSTIAMHISSPIPTGHFNAHYNGTVDFDIYGKFHLCQNELFLARKFHMFFHMNFF